jgi:hypothetical protein
MASSKFLLAAADPFSPICRAHAVVKTNLP